jgi:hypothetical protein
MDPRQHRELLIPRRNLLHGAAWGLGAAAMTDLLHADGLRPLDAGALGTPHLAPRAKRVIWLFMSGAPSQIDMWDHKPKLREMYDQDIPDSVVNGQRFTTMTSGQTRFPIAPSIFDFAKHGECGMEVSELLPHTAKIVDELCLLRSVHTSSINHDPGITFIQTGSEQPGRPSMGAWLSYGLGSSNRDLPTFVVLHSSWSAKRDAQALYSRLWGSGWLPSEHQGVGLRSVGDPVLYLSDPPGVSAAERRRMLDGLAALNARRQEELGDPEIGTRIAQYEMAHRMQTSVPELVDLASEPESVLDLYGPDVKQPGTFAHNCLMARRLAERDVRFTQVFIRGWDQHGNLPADIRLQCKDVDQACAGLITDLKQRGMLEDTLVVWGGEFGRTAYCQGQLSPENYGRDHHPRCFSTWLAGGGVRPGTVYGTTDDFSYNIVDKPVHIHDLNATILHLLGIDHERLTYRFQGRDFRLTDVHGKVVHDIIA